MRIAYLPIHLFRCVDERQVGIYSTKALDGNELVQCRVFWTKNALLTTNRYSLAHDFSSSWSPFSQERSKTWVAVAQRLACLYHDWKVVGSSPTCETFLNCDKAVIIKKDIRNHNTRHYSTWNISKYSPHHAHFHHIFSHIRGVFKKFAARPWRSIDRKMT